MIFEPKKAFPGGDQLSEKGEEGRVVQLVCETPFLITLVCAKVSTVTERMKAPSL